MSKFDAAIRILKGLEFEDYYGDEAKASVEAAIRVLEAAGKVEKTQAMKWHSDRTESWWAEDEEYEQIKALLAALPDKEEK